eukprot:COSAG01_NODE_57817_length_309_cov_91.057143_1_plen_69_part_10
MPIKAPVPKGDLAQIISGILEQLTGAEQFGVDSDELDTGWTATSCSTTCHAVVSTCDELASSPQPGGPA